jgi:hypothetical protein
MMKYRLAIVIVLLSTVATGYWPLNSQRNETYKNSGALSTSPAPTKAKHKTKTLNQTLMEMKQSGELQKQQMEALKATDTAAVSRGQTEQLEQASKLMEQTEQMMLRVKAAKEEFDNHQIIFRRLIDHPRLD